MLYIGIATSTCEVSGLDDGTVIEDEIFGMEIGQIQYLIALELKS